MKIIIAGDGKVGATLTRQLTSEGYDVTIIDSKASPLESSVERYDVISQYPEVAQRLMKIADDMRADLGDNLTRRKPTGQRQHGLVDKKK